MNNLKSQWKFKCCNNVNKCWQKKETVILYIFKSNSHNTPRPTDFISCVRCLMSLELDTLSLLSHSAKCPLVNRTESPRLLACILCEYRSSHKSHMKRHIRIHIGDRPHHCTLCNKSFVEQNDLKRHLTQHEKANVLGDWWK